MAGLIRAVEAAGGFAAVIRKGERDAGTILAICAERGENRRIFERMPHPSGGRVWTQIPVETPENAEKFDGLLNRRLTQDPDLWIIELDIANGERFIGLTGTAD